MAGPYICRNSALLKEDELAENILTKSSKTFIFFQLFFGLKSAL